MSIGYMLSEQLRYDEVGAPLDLGTWEYKPPLARDHTPEHLGVSFLAHTPNPRGVYGSKAVGEPAMLASVAVLNALREAVNAVRADAGLAPVQRLDAPATPAVILAALPRVTP